MQIIEESLKKFGLSESEAKIYLASMRLGSSKAGAIIDYTQMPRATVYDILDSLSQKGLISIHHRGAGKIFVPEDPQILLYQLEKREKDIQEQKVDLNRVMAQLTLIKNPHSAIPQVRFYEGFEGVKNVVMDNLHSKTEILMYVNVDRVLNSSEEIKDLNREYLLKRIEKNVNKKILALDTILSKKISEKGNADHITEMRFIDSKLFPFDAGAMEIYDNKISYLILDPDQYHGIIIESKSIYEMHKSLFMMHWQNAKTQ